MDRPGSHRAGRRLAQRHRARQRGKVVSKDVACSLQVGRPVLTVAGSGRTADQLASAVSGGPADERAVRLAASGLVEVVNADDLAALQDALGARLQPPA
jgi:SLOG in TRPM, prokaryote